MIFEN